MSLTDRQIKDLAKRMNIPLADVVFKDELPNRVQMNKTYIINIESSVDENGNENDGTHWVMAQCVQYPNGKKACIYFDPYGAPPPEIVKKVFSKSAGMQSVPYTEKDIQSLMNNACGYYCLAIAHYINSSQYRTGDLYSDVSDFMDMFEDLNKSVDFKKNEYILKHFFRSSEPEKRKDIEVIAPIDRITKEDEQGGIDPFKHSDNPNMEKLPMQFDVKYINQK